MDEDGVPRRLPVEDWLSLADRPGSGAPSADWLRAVLRFSRPDGSPVFGARGRSPERLRALEASAARVNDPGLAWVVARWLPRSRLEAPGPPPLPADARPDRPLAVLRPDWTPRGDLVAVDHREPGPGTLVEVSSKGQTWLGPSWTSPVGEGSVGRASPTHWSTGAFADCAEWSYRAGRGRVTRSVALIRGRGMAILGQQDDGSGPSTEVRLGLPDGIEATPDPGSRALLLSAGRGRPSAHLVHLGLPPTDYRTDCGSIAVEGREVVLRQASEGRRRWLPWLVSWEKAPATWRTLTVASRSRACRPDEAAAVRVGFGLGSEGLVVYRSLGPPGLRSFLGHQTKARFLVGGFDRSGAVRPILKVDS